jgi:hypothetical protein
MPQDPVLDSNALDLISAGAGQAITQSLRGTYINIYEAALAAPARNRRGNFNERAAGPDRHCQGTDRGSQPNREEAMTNHNVRVINYPLEISEDGESPKAFHERCEELEKYIVSVRLPQSLKGVALWVEPCLRQEAGQLRLDLVLFHDGQLPLLFKAGKDRKAPPALTEELDRLAESIEASLAKSNEVWVEAAQILNDEANPAAEIEFLRWKSGFDAPKRSRSLKVPHQIHLMTRSKQLTLSTMDFKNEYVETELLMIHGTPTATIDGLKFKVSKAELVTPDPLFHTMVIEGQPVFLRWPQSDTYPWRILTGLSVLLEESMVILGRGAISTGTLACKAIEVQQVLDGNRLIATLQGAVTPALEYTCPQ